MMACYIPPSCAGVCLLYIHNTSSIASCQGVIFIASNRLIHMCYLYRCREGAIMMVDHSRLETRDIFGTVLWNILVSQRYEGRQATITSSTSSPIMASTRRLFYFIARLSGNIGVFRGKKKYKDKEKNQKKKKTFSFLYCHLVYPAIKFCYIERKNG